MYSGTILAAGKIYRTACLACNRILVIGGGQEAGGYRYPTHHSPLNSKSIATQKCIGSEDYVPESELVRLASLQL